MMDLLSSHPVISVLSAIVLSLVICGGMYLLLKSLWRGLVSFLGLDDDEEDDEQTVAEKFNTSPEGQEITRRERRRLAGGSYDFHAPQRYDGPQSERPDSSYEYR